MKYCFLNATSQANTIKAEWGCEKNSSELGQTPSKTGACTLLVRLRSISQEVLNKSKMRLSDI